MQEQLIRVNVLDEETGYGSKEECHRNGWLHRAFSVFLYRGSQLFIQRRALDKYHSGGLWSNACCSHPRKGESLEEAVQVCYENAKEGDAVLLSPACASWGMFRNYEERGNLFKEIVRDLKE